MITAQEYTAWLSDQSAVRCILVEAIANVENIETTRYFSTTNYVTGASDTPANTQYKPLIVGSISFTEKLWVDNKTGFSSGAIDLQNMDGAIDSWLMDIWENRAVQVFLGDVRWARADFRTIFTGLSSQMSVSGKDKLSLKLADKMQRLNSPVTDVKIGGISTNADKIVPVLIGECFNITPILTSESSLTYKIAQGTLDSIIEVRDEGAPTTTVDTLGSGEFDLTVDPLGLITCSAQGDVTTHNIADAIKFLVKNYGNTDTQLTDADIDLANFSAFSSAHNQRIGWYVSSRDNLVRVIQQLAASVGAQCYFNKAGKLKLTQLNLPATSPTLTISSNDVYEYSVKIAKVHPVVASTKIGFNKNWSVQSNLRTGLPEDHKDLFEESWLTITSTDAATATKYKINDDPLQKDTALLTSIDATAEANRLLTMFKTKRFTYSMRGLPHLSEIEIGTEVTLDIPERYSLSGVDGVVTAVKTDWITLNVDIEVTV